MADKHTHQDESEADRRFAETLGRLANTPPKPHRPKLKMLAPRLNELPDRLQPAKTARNKTGAKTGKPR